MTIKLTEKHINTLKEIVLDHLQGTEPNAENLKQVVEHFTSQSH